MPRCTYCRGNLGDDRDKVGSRCPHCRQPLYENPRDPHQPGLQTEAGTPCSAHPGNPAIGPCQRCGNYMCVVCRTRWRNQAVCVGCVDRALASKEASPAEAKAHFRQAILSVVMGVAAWLTMLGAFGLIALGASNGPNKEGMVYVGLGGLLIIFSPLPGLLGVGQGAAAIRVRGDHMILATIGLILSGLHTGMVLGIITASVALREKG